MNYCLACQSACRGSVPAEIFTHRSGYLWLEFAVMLLMSLVFRFVCADGCIKKFC